MVDAMVPMPYEHDEMWGDELDDLLECCDCGWVGTADQLVALTDWSGNKSFVYCPNCQSAAIEDMD